MQDPFSFCIHHTSNPQLQTPCDLDINFNSVDVHLGTDLDGLHVDVEKGLGADCDGDAAFNDGYHREDDLQHTARVELQIQTLKIREH